MGFFTGFIMAIVALGVVMLLYKNIKHQPGLFSKTNINKSLHTLGLLALLLIGIIGLVAMLLRG